MKEFSKTIQAIEMNSYKASHRVQNLNPASNLWQCILLGIYRYFIYEYQMYLFFNASALLRSGAEVRVAIAMGNWLMPRYPNPAGVPLDLNGKGLQARLEINPWRLLV